MFGQIDVKLNVNPYNVSRIALLGSVLLGISFFSGTHLGYIQASRESFLRSRTPNATNDEIYSSCNISYDDSRCSLQPTNYNNSKVCLTDVDAMAGHILPLVLFVMEVCLIQDLFVLSGKYSHILVNILWLVFFFTFIIIAIAVHGGTCYHLNATYIISIVGCLLGGFVLHLFLPSNKHRFPDENHIAPENTTVPITNHDPEILEKVVIT